MVRTSRPWRLSRYSSQNVLRSCSHLSIRFAGLKRWRELQVRLAELEPFRDNIPALIDFVLPEVEEPDPDNDHALLRRTALGCIPDIESIEDLPNMIRYRIGQPDVPLETPYARVMSFHKSKGLTAQLVILAGLVDGLVPRIDSGDPVAEQRAQLEEQRRLFFVGMTRTTDILVFSSYSQLPADIAQNLRVRRGAFIPGAHAYRVFASPFLEETGLTLPPAVRGLAWIA